MQLDAMARSHSTGDKATTGLQAFKAGIPHWGTNMFEDDIHPFATSKRPHPLQDVFTSVIDPGLCPQSAGFPQLFRTASRGDHPRAEGATKLNGKGADTTAGSGNEDRFPWTHAGSVHHHLPGGQPCYR